MMSGYVADLAAALIFRNVGRMRKPPELFGARQVAPRHPLLLRHFILMTARGKIGGYVLPFGRLRRGFAIGRVSHGGHCRPTT